jgi:hypothetical protein
MLKTSRAVALAGLLALLIGFEARSQEPAQGPGTQQEQPQTPKTDEPSSNQSQRAAPAPTIIYVQPPTKSEAEAEEDRHERQEKANLDRRLVELTAELSEYTGGLYQATVALAVATAGLLIATFGLVIFAFFQARDMRASVAVAKQSADALVSAESAHLFLIIEIDGVTDGMMTLARNRERLTEEGQITSNLQSTFFFQNFGRTPAVLKEMTYRIIHPVRLPHEPEYPPVDTDSMTRQMREKTIGAGLKSFIHDCSLEGSLTGKEAKEIIDGKSAIYFYGRVLYDDVFGRPREHRFIWHYAGNGLRPFYGNEKYSKNS